MPTCRCLLYCSDCPRMNAPIPPLLLVFGHSLPQGTRMVEVERVAGGSLFVCSTVPHRAKSQRLGENSSSVGVSCRGPFLRVVVCIMELIMMRGRGTQQAVQDGSSVRASDAFVVPGLRCLSACFFSRFVVDPRPPSSSEMIRESGTLTVRVPLERRSYCIRSRAG